MKKLLLFPLFFILFFWGNLTFVFAQGGVVNDVEGNRLKRISLKLQSTEKVIATSSKILLSAMSGDVTGSLEVLLEQSELFKNNEELRSTLGALLKGTKSVKLFENKLKLGANAYKTVTT